MNLLRSKVCLVLLFVFAVVLSGIFGEKVYADTVKVKNCAAWKADMSYTYMNQNLDEVCTDEAREKVCGHLGWEACAADATKSELTVGELSEGEKVTDNVATGTDEDAKVCYENSGKLGWIICPIVSGLSGAGQWLWEEVEANFLQIRVGEFFKSGGGVETAWQIFRDMANVIFIILFMVVIFSQLTGVGIDNYGIKKIMPKLIVVVILINLSYVICMLAVDLSNILGSGLNGLFSGIAVKVGETASVPMEGYTAGQSLAAVGVFGGGFVLFTLISSGPIGALTFVGAIVAVGLAVLGIVITIVISMLFMFLILMIRNAGIVILIAIAPVAIVCYMLPNTEKLFKRWADLLKSLLLVYPICGAMIGAGKLAGIILASTGTEAMAVAGMIVEVLPFFLIPTLLKRSLALAGNIGTKLSGVGKTAGRGLSSKTRGAIQGSRGFKEFSQFEQNRAGVRRANRIQKKLEGRLASGRTLSNRQQSKLRTAQDVVLAQRKTEQENTQRTREGYANAMMQKQDIATEMEAAAIARLNDPVAQRAQRESLAAKVVDEATAQRLSLMRSAGAEGGITMRDGTKMAYTLPAAERRMTELEEDSRTRALSEQEQQELSALARGMANMSGGAGMMARVIRGANNGAGGVNQNFMAAMGRIYSSDGTVQAKLNEKDAGAAIYTEQFMTGGAGLASAGAGGAGGAGGGVGTFDDYRTSAATAAEYQTQLGQRLKTHEAGLSQSGTALEEYLDTLDASPTAHQAYQDIIDNDHLMNSLDAGDREKVRAHARAADVKGKSVTMIDTAEGGTADIALKDISANTGTTAAATAQTAINTFEVRKNTGVIRNNTDEMVLGVRQTAINTNRGANAAERAAESAKQAALGTRQTAINTNKIVKKVDRPKK